MAQQPARRKQPTSKQDKQQETKSRNGQNGHDDQVASYVQELAGYLQERIKPGLNSGAIPLLARSIANEIAHREPPPGLSDDTEDAEDKPDAEADAEPTGKADDETKGEAEDETKGAAEDEDDAKGEAEADDERGSAEDDEDEDKDEDSTGSEAQADFEADMHDLQAELGEDWILRFSVHGDDAWLTAEKDDGSQRIEAQTAAVLTQAVELLNEGGGRSG
jgi:hypothetical protein